MKVCNFTVIFPPAKANKWHYTTTFNVMVTRLTQLCTVMSDPLAISDEWTEIMRKGCFNLTDRTTRVSLYKIVINYCSCTGTT